MESLPAFVAGVVVGLVLAGAVAWIRRGSVTDLGGPTGSGQTGSGQPMPMVAGDPPAEGGSPLAAMAPGTAFEQTTRGFRSTKTIIRRVGARLDPSGQLTIDVDGQTYHRLEDVPDAATREQVRAVLAAVPAQVQDPDKRAKVEAELELAGIEDAPPHEDPAAANPSSADSASSVDNPSSADNPAGATPPPA